MRLEVLAQMQRERVEALLAEQRVRQRLHAPNAGEQQWKTGIKRTVLVIVVGAVLAALWLAQLT